jgi:hypothetical protein
MPSWFDEEIEKHNEEREAEERRRNEEMAQANRERDEFRSGFEFAVENIIVPSLEAFVSSANNHGFTSSYRKEVDAQGRLRAVMLGLYAVQGDPVSGGGLDHCLYKVTLQMNTRRIAHMITFDNIPGQERDTKNDFLDLDSLAESEFEDRLKAFLKLALEYCRGPQ